MKIVRVSSYSTSLPSMKKAVRSETRAAFFMLGKLVEHDETNTIFMNPKEKLTEDYITGRFG